MSKSLFSEFLKGLPQLGCINLRFKSMLLGFKKQTYQHHLTLRKMCIVFDAHLELGIRKYSVYKLF